MRIFYCVAALALLSGCTGSLLRLAVISPDANDYPSSLASEYQAYSQSEAEQGHLLTADYFAAKGMKALRGEPVEPELPTITNAKSLQDELMKARSELLSTQTDDIKRVVPQKVARAQLLYDCWSHQKSLKVAEQVPCEDEFRATLTELQMIADSFVYGQETNHIVTFAAKSAKLGPKGKALINEISKRAYCITNYAIEIHTHGSGKMLAVGSKRANAIRDAFIGEGIPADKMKVISENDSKVVHLSSDSDAAGPDGVKIVMRTFGMVGI